MAGITRKQTVLIKVAVRDLNIPDSHYREILLERYWVDSSTKLSYEEAADLIDHFKTMGFKVRPRKKRKREKQPPNMETLLYMGHPMTRKIEQLEGDIRWYTWDGAQRFARKIIGKDRPTTTKEGAKYIEALKGLRKSQNKQEAHG